MLAAVPAKAQRLRLVRRDFQLKWRQARFQFALELLGFVSPAEGRDLGNPGQ